MITYLLGLCACLGRIFLQHTCFTIVHNKAFIKTEANRYIVSSTGLMSTLMTVCNEVETTNDE